jgi:hypothetical protein
VVVEQPVGLIGAEIVRVGEDVLVAADLPKTGDELAVDRWR